MLSRVHQRRRRGEIEAAVFPNLPAAAGAGDSGMSQPPAGSGAHTGSDRAEPGVGDGTRATPGFAKSCGSWNRAAFPNVRKPSKRENNKASGRPAPNWSRCSIAERFLPEILAICGPTCGAAPNGTPFNSPC